MKLYKIQKFLDIYNSLLLLYFGYIVGKWL
jgi:hypothetical protein